MGRRSKRQGADDAPTDAARTPHVPRYVLIQRLAASDTTFERRVVRGEALLVGRCFHCNSSLAVGANGDALGATIEHIVPRSQGGTDALENLALACARCNQRKGASLDARRADDPRVLEVQAALLERRRARFRAPASG